MKPKSRLFLTSISVLAATAFLSGSVYAAWAVTDNANSFSVNITVGSAPRTVTFYMPNKNDTTCLTYLTEAVVADYGETLDDIQVPSTAAFLGFSFAGWYTDSAYTSSFSTSTPISSDMSLYAKFNRNNVLYDNNNHYFVSSNSDQTVDAQYIYKISTQTWGLTPSVSASNKVDLLSSSGIYKMTYASSNWTILRKVGFCAKDTSWWGNDNYVTWAYGQPEDRNSWGDKYWSGTPSVDSVYISGSNKGTVYIDYSMPYIGALRYAPGVTPDLSDGNKRPTNNTNHIALDSGYGYSKDTIYQYIYNNGTEVGWGS